MALLTYNHLVTSVKIVATLVNLDSVVKFHESWKNMRTTIGRDVQRYVEVMMNRFLDDRMLERIIALVVGGFSKLGSTGAVRVEIEKMERIYLHQRQSLLLDTIFPLQ